MKTMHFMSAMPKGFFKKHKDLIIPDIIFNFGNNLTTIGLSIMKFSNKKIKAVNESLSKRGKVE